METVDWRTKESLATRRDEARLQGPENAKEMRRAKTINVNDIDDLVRGGAGSHRRTRLRFGIPCFAGKYREFLPLEVGAGDAAPSILEQIQSVPSEFPKDRNREFH